MATHQQSDFGFCGFIGRLGFFADRMASHPYTATQGTADRQHQDASLEAAQAEQATRHVEHLAAHLSTHDGIAGLFARIDVLTAQVAASNPQQAGPFAETLTELAGSTDPEDVAIAQQAVDQSPEAAADALMAEGAAGKRRDAERFRQAARLYAPSSPSKAKAAYEEAVALDPTDIWAWIELGRLKLHYDSITAARGCFGSALERVTDERDRMVLHVEFGEVLLIEGALADARGEYEAGLAIAERLAQGEPGNAEWQRDLSVSYNRLGDIEVAAGNLAAARSRYEAGLAIAERLAHAEPGNAEWQRDLSISYDKLGDIEVAAGNLAAARSRYEVSLAIRERLARGEPGNAGWQRDLLVSHGKLGDLAEAMGDRAEAAERYRAALSIAAALVERWPDHPGFASDLAITRRRLAALGGDG